MSTPKGYIFVEIEVTDMENYRLHYMSRTTTAVTKYGGRFIVRGSDVAVKSGSIENRRIVVLEFQTYERALEFYDSTEYQEAIRYRDKYAKVDRFYIMKGVDEAF